MSTTSLNYQGPATASFQMGGSTTQNQPCTVTLNGAFDPAGSGSLLIAWKASEVPCQISFTWPGGAGNPASLFVSDPSGVQWESLTTNLTAVNWGAFPPGYIGNWSASSPESTVVNAEDSSYSMTLAVTSVTFSVPWTGVNTE
jgi:hypothetical protein